MTQYSMTWGLRYVPNILWHDMGFEVYMSFSPSVFEPSGSVAPSHDSTKHWERERDEEVDKILLGMIPKVHINGACQPKKPHPNIFSCRILLFLSPMRWNIIHQTQNPYILCIIWWRLIYFTLFKYIQRKH